MLNDRFYCESNVCKEPAIETRVQLTIREYIARSSYWRCRIAMLSEKFLGTSVIATIAYTITYFTAVAF